jgi:hypothetical protein
MKRLSIFAAALTVLTACCTQAQAERPYWKLEFKHTGLHYVKVGGDLVAYTTYQVTNNTGADREFNPIFRVETDTDRLTYAMPSAEALAAIETKHGMKFKDIDRIGGTLKDGESKVGVAIFFKLDPRADHVKLYITGLTNRYRYQDEDNRKGFQRYEYFVHWFRPGDDTNRATDRVDTLFDGWIWRSTGDAAAAPTTEEDIEK